jgi:hypothetical protein
MGGPVTARRLATLLTLAACVMGCSHARDERVRHAPPDAGVVIDTSVMAYLSMARALHHEANLKEDNDAPGAIAALHRLTTTKTPHPGRVVPEVEDVLADTFARIAELQVRQGELSNASESVRQGLTHASGPTYFRGHLLEVGGVTEEARAAALRDAGDKDAAAAATTAALGLLHQAVLVQEQVVTEALAGDAGSRGGNAP